MDLKEPSAKYLVEPTYKQTDAGVLPCGWEVKRIGELEPFITSGSRGWAAYYSDRGSPFIRITNLSRTCIYPDLEDLRFVSLAANDSEAARTNLQVGDVLLSITADIGIVGYVDARVPTPAYINQHIALVRFDSRRISPKYVSYFLASEGPQRLFRALTDSGAKAGINLTTVQKIHLALPPTKAEQEAIAEALSDADALIESLEQLVAKKRLIKQGAMQELLTGKRRLPGFSGEWEVRAIGDVADCLDNLRLPLNDAQRSKRKGDYPYCGANGVLDHIDDYCVDDAVVLIAEDGGYFDEYATRAIAYRMSGKFWVNNHAHILKSKPQFDQDYLFYSLVHKNVLSFLASGTRAKLNKAELNKIMICQPSAPAEQSAIAAVLSEMDAALAALETKLTKACQIKQGMMQNLLTGRIRLV